MRQDLDDEEYLEGYFSWREGKGRIVWDTPDEGSDDPGGPASTEPYEVYRTDPLPRDLFLNASRLIEINLFTPGRTTKYGSTCDRDGLYLGAEIYSGSKLLAGVGAGQVSMNWGWDAKTKGEFPPDPEGHGTCRLRLATEVLEVAEGTVLEVRITYRQGSTHIKYGMGGEHASVLRLPYFGEEETLYRFPSFAHSLAPSANVEAPDAGSLLTWLGLTSLPVGGGMVRFRRKQMLGVLLLASALTMALGGCVQPGAGPQKATNVAQVSASPSYQHGDLSRPGYGALMGLVLSSDWGRPISGVFVSLLGTSNFTRTNPQGRFSFSDLAGGDYRLRLDHDGFHSIEAPVQIRVDVIARLNLTMTPVGLGDPSKRPHLHDYWAGEERVVLLDRKDLGVRCSGLGVATCAPVLAFMIPPDESRFTSILPGTYDVNVTLDWDPRAPNTCFRADKVELWFQANNDGSPFNATRMLARGPREPFHIGTSWEMEDRGHQKFSTWVFIITPVTPSSDYVASVNRQVDCNRSGVELPPPFFVTVTITKGVVPPEPAHIDFWQGHSALKVMDEVPAQAKARGTWPGVGVSWDAAFQPTSIVPPGTEWIDVYANASRPPQVPYDVHLMVKSARSGPCATDCWEETQKDQCLVVVCDLWRERCESPGFARVGTSRPSGQSFQWTFKVGDGDPDPFYAVRSFWVGALCTAQDTTTRTLAAVDVRTGIQFTITMVARRGPAHD